MLGALWLGATLLRARMQAGPPRDIELMSSLVIATGALIGAGITLAPHLG